MRYAAGVRVGNVVLIERAPSRVGQSGRVFARWCVECDCGRRTYVDAQNLKRTRTCGCGIGVHGTTRHGHTAHGRESAEYRAWKAMITRATNQKIACAKNYSLRGITVCARWRESFEAFLTDMGPKPSAAYTLDRIDNDGNYEPGNCRWATRRVQVLNSRRWPRRAA